MRPFGQRMLLGIVLGVASVLAVGCGSTTTATTTRTATKDRSDTSEVGTLDGAAPKSTVGAPSTTKPLKSAPPARSLSTTIDPLRPFVVNVAKSYDPAVAAPLLIVLHGYTGTGESMKKYVGLQSLADARGFLTVYPDGTKDGAGAGFWNATVACCNFGAVDIDDSAYLASIIDAVSANYRVDPKRVYFLGHSNGGFMSYRMACEHADKVAAIVSIAGAANGQAGVCKPSEPVSVLQIHGTADPTIAYAGGSIGRLSYPSAVESVTSWVGTNSCAARPTESTVRLDLVADLAGKETTVSSFAPCSRAAAELWSMNGAGHSPVFSATFAANVLDFLMAHPKE